MRRLSPRWALTSTNAHALTRARTATAPHFHAESATFGVKVRMAQSSWALPSSTERSRAASMAARRAARTPCFSSSRMALMVVPAGEPEQDAGVDHGLDQEEEVSRAGTGKRRHGVLLRLRPLDDLA